MKSMKRANNKSLGLFAIAIAGVSLFAACTVRTPTTETPIPNDHGVDKTFFQETSTAVTAEGLSVTKIKPKTFLCGWAPISENGAISSQYMMHAVHMGGHCNMEFEIAENVLVGKLVNPTFPNDRSRWKTALRIHINKHYYYEKAKDAYGRETNEFVENAGRSHFSSRPMIDLDFQGLQIDDWDASVLGSDGIGSITSVTDVEWDKKTGFLGFTVATQTSYWGGAVGGKIRFNFKAFEHNPNFKVTPYSPLNAKHFNALHVMGEKVDGINQIWSAAKWDLSKTHEIYMYGFPDEYAPVAQKVVDQWNEAFTSIGKPAAFHLNKAKMKYPFDLRYPMMVWVDDPQISAYSPLGIGMANADVRNGEIQWGQITLYGGMLERYVKSHLGPVGSTESSASAKSIDSKIAQAPSFFQTYFNPTKSLQTVPGLDARGLERLEAHINSMGPKLDADALHQKLIASIQQKSGSPATAQQIEMARNEARKSFQQISQQRLNGIRQELRSTFDSSAGEMQARQERTAAIRGDVKQLFGFLGNSSAEKRAAVFGKDESSMTRQQKYSKLTGASAEMLQRMSGGVVQDVDRRFIDVGPGLIAGLAQSGVSYEEGLHKVIHELIVHEFGHMLGLGHQFKENIVPAPGTVPQKYITALNKGVANNLTNSSSVMGYKHPITEIVEDAALIGPGPQDLLTLRYLYNQEYSTFRRNSDDADFTFAKVPASGLIPAVNPDRPEFATSYFPQCNDFDATFGADPYCNRFDRGNDAQTIVKNYFDDLNANMVSKIYAFTDTRGGNTDEAESYLWWRSLDTLGRIRTFYDHMRQKFEPEIRSISGSERDLYEFSRVCSGEVEGSKQLKDLFTSKPELKELCKVNRMAVREMMNLMTIPGPDRSRMDWDSANIAGGMTGGDADSDYSRVWGTHTALSVMPLKLSAINALTTPYPYTMLGGWMFPVPRYAGADGLFSYSTMYPVEFTEALAVAVEKNLKFTSLSGNSATMGMPITSMGYFIDQQSYANDSTRMPKDFIENIRNQTNFRISLKAVILQMKTREDKSRITHFEGDLYDPNTDRTQRIPEAFVLPQGKIIVRPASRNFVYPLTKIMFLSDEVAYAWAYHVEYDDKHDDVLAAHSVKATLEKLNNSILDSCIRGNNDGLASFFNSQVDQSTYPGFLVMSGIAGDKEKQLRFLDSVKENFARFYAVPKNTATPERCENAVRGVGMIVSTAAMLNGYFLPEVLDYLVK
ncbi:hypothetical protein BH10BDE1_BH10BDE1_24040 [soil metagenome]